MQLLELGKQLLTLPDIDKVLSAAIDGAIEITRAERGMIILFDDSGKHQFQTARNLDNKDIEAPQFEVSWTIINKVKTSAENICLQNALEDPEFESSRSASRLKLLSVICLPLLFDKKLFGVVYLDNRSIRGVFQEEIFRFIRHFADFISLAAHHALERKQLQNHIDALQSTLRDKYNFDAIVGAHPKMIELLDLVGQVAGSDASVLIQGESGTGKELIARALHANSPRKDKPFVPLNCGALPAMILESELFGHVKGAFTGAVSDKNGWFERANGGTIFLDEVSEMPKSLQVKLLRVLHDGEYARVGSTELKACDVRVVAATNKNLKLLVEKKRFRQDLYYRLNVFEIEAPPLCERREDIPLLARHFLDRFAQKQNKTGLRLSSEAESLLMAYQFPGNVRELENIMQRAVILAEADTIEPKHLPSTVCRTNSSSEQAGKIFPFKIAKQRIVEAFERDYLSDCLHATQGNISAAARLAGINVKNFYLKMRAHKIDPGAFKKR